MVPAAQSKSSDITGWPLAEYTAFVIPKLAVTTITNKRKAVTGILNGGWSALVGVRGVAGMTGRALTADPDALGESSWGLSLSSSAMSDVH